MVEISRLGKIHFSGTLCGIRNYLLFDLPIKYFVFCYNLRNTNSNKMFTFGLPSGYQYITLPIFQDSQLKVSSIQYCQYLLINHVFDGNLEIVNILLFIISELIFY